MNILEKIKSDKAIKFLYQFSGYELQVVIKYSQQKFLNSL